MSTGRLTATPSDAPEIGTARVAFNTGTIESAAYADGIDLVASYGIVGDELAVEGPIDDRHTALWETVLETVPEEWRAGIRQFSVVEEGRAGTVAMVHQSGVDPDRWLLSIDQADADNHRLLTDTLIHELAHLVTLGTDVFTFSHRLTGPCDGVIVEVGCAHPGSMLARWAEAFWDEPGREAAYDPRLHVAPYAATGPHEDLAETFLHWHRGDEAPTDSILAAKYAFLDAEPELAAFAPR